MSYPELGLVANLKILSFCLGLFRTKVFRYYQRRQESVNETINNAFLSGISTREVSKALKPILETTYLSLCIKNNQKFRYKIKEFHKRKLLANINFYSKDGITLSVETS